MGRTLESWQAVLVLESLEAPLGALRLPSAAEVALVALLLPSAAAVAAVEPVVELHAAVVLPEAGMLVEIPGSQREVLGSASEVDQLLQRLVVQESCARCNS